MKSNIIKFYIVCFIILFNYSPGNFLFGQSAAKNLGSQINSSSDETSPIITLDGSAMYFTRRKHPENLGGIRDNGDIWMATKNADGTWGAAKNLGSPVNNKFTNEIIGLTADGNKMYLQNHYLADGSKPSSQGISVSTKSGNSWGIPVALDIPYFYNKSDHQSASLHATGKIIVLSLQSYDTRGAEDIYVIFQQSNGTWSEPRNLGNNINTQYQEMTPFLAPDGKTLFFASNGYEGYGSRDIYKSVRQDDSWKNWSEPQNLGSTVNTEGVELYYRINPDGETALLSSTQNSDGLGDINEVPVPDDEQEIAEPQQEIAIIEEEVQEPVEEEPIADVLVKGKITNTANTDPVAGTIIFTSLDSASSFTAETNQNGEYEVNLPADGNYAAQISASGYLGKKDRLLLRQLSTAGTLTRDFNLTPIEVGATVQLSNVLFERGTTEMIGNSNEDLEDVVALMKENPEMEIEVSGHTDNTGRPDLNLLLSQDRADAVKKYLVGQGIGENRITAKGYGGSRPIADNRIEEERRKNRRVEFTILKK